MQVKLKGNKKGQSNYFVDGKFFKAGEVIDVPESFYETNKDQFVAVGTVENADIQRMAAEAAKTRADLETSIRAEFEAKNAAEVDKRVAAELKKREEEAAKTKK